MLKYQKNVVKIKWFHHYSSSKADFVKVSIVFTTWACARMSHGQM